MARSAVSDPLEKFRFKVTWSDTNSETTSDSAGFHDVQMPKRTTNKILYREGDDSDISTVSAGLSTMEDIILSRGLISSHGSTGVISTFYSWMSAVHRPGQESSGYNGGTTGKLSTTTGGAANYRKTLTITMFDREGNIARQWELRNAWPVHFVPGSDLNAAEDGDKSIESLTLAYEDFIEIAVSGNKAPVLSTSLA